MIELRVLTINDSTNLEKTRVVTGTKSNEGYNRWYLDFRPTIPDRRPLGFYAYHLYGRIAMFELFKTDKLTIVVNDEKDFNMLMKRPPLSLRANLYVMLIDLEWGKIVKEEMLCKYTKD